MATVRRSLSPTTYIYMRAYALQILYMPDWYHGTGMSDVIIIMNILIIITAIFAKNHFSGARTWMNLSSLHYNDSDTTIA